MKPEHFPLLRSAQQNLAQFDQAVEQLAIAQQAGGISRPLFRHVQDTLSRAVYRAWDKHIDQRFFQCSKQIISPELARLYRALPHMRLHSVITVHEKLQKSTFTGPIMAAMQHLIDEAYPLAEAVNALKDKMIEGPLSLNSATKQPKPRPAKIIKTCPVCFRAIALIGGYMANHGYQRSGRMIQTAPCAGFRFPPLEHSNEGLIWLIQDLYQRQALIQSALDDQANLSRLVIPGKGLNGGATTLTRDSPSWPSFFEHHVAQLTRELGQLETEIQRREEQLSAWQPEDG
ncbi:hypothetical protein HZU77_007040 [Neisseriaceae bacterium TC5R-5]|nr:hypothetical protein [Neisseriaceae bacterium TC5R-5]